MIRLALIASAAFLLTGCDWLDDQITRRFSPADMCETDFTLREPVLREHAVDTEIRIRANTETCVRKWAYRLAASDEPGSAVAAAVVRACDNEISNYQVTWLSIMGLGRDSNDTITLTTGATVPVSIYQHKMFDDIARLEVMKARVAKCVAP